MGPVGEHARRASHYIKEVDRRPAGRKAHVVGVNFPDGVKEYEAPTLSEALQQAGAAASERGYRL